MSLIPVLSYDEGLEQLVKLFIKRELVPIFGAGFTAGCQACRGAVPNAQNATESMLNLILQSGSCPMSQDELASMNFFEISDLFFDYVDREKRAAYFEDYYTDVRLLHDQARFLTELSWPYAYTLNIDNGIENNSDFTPILPYRKLRRPRTSKKLLYKLHGDAVYESHYIDDSTENIVFSRSQYMQAITNEANRDIYQALLSDYGQKHMLFIGCSLQDEQDLQYIFNSCKPYQKDVYRIVLRTQEPSALQQNNLKKHGINEIILLENYESFYSDFISLYEGTIKANHEQIYKFENPKIIYQHKKTEALSLISGKNIFDLNRNTFYKSSLHILRTVTRAIEDELSSNFFVLLKGRRFSGKTYVLCSLAEYYKSKDVYYFPSMTFADEEVVEALFQTSKNSLFLFDSNSISPDVYFLIIHYSTSLKDNNNYMVVATSSNDNHLLTELSCNVVDLSNQFVGEELDQSRKAQDSFALSQRKKGQTNIDYLYVLKRDQNIDISFVTADLSLLTSKEKAILVAICALDKLYYSDLIALNTSAQEVAALCNKVQPFVELVPTTKDEATRHSTTKLVHNSKIALIELLKQFQTQDICNSIIYIVRRFKSDCSRRRLYIEIILFDTLNQIFAGHSNSSQLINTIYVSLQSLLENDLHYWLQRAKSIYRTQRSVEILEEAYTYAKKAYLDGHFELSAKAALTSALISCAIAEQQSGDADKTSYYEESVKLAHEAVFSNFFHLHPSYLNSELLIGKNTQSERRVIAACNNVRNHSQNVYLVEQSEEILARFEELRIENRKKKKN